jgi:hypothetical protein
MSAVPDPVAFTPEIDQYAPEWVRGIQKLAKYIGHASRGLHIVLDAVVAVLGGLAAGFRTVAERMGV